LSQELVESNERAAERAAELHRLVDVRACCDGMLLALINRNTY
jgi:hypothetical protein